MTHSLLVTGGAGFIGTNFVHYWHRHHPGDHIIALDALTYAGNKENLTALLESPMVDFVHGNILEQERIEQLMHDHNVDTVVHFAAESHVDRSILGPDAFIETNISGTHALLKAARQVWLEDGIHRDNHRFHHVSTDEVYGSLSPDAPPFSETTPYAPNSPYAASKAASDHIVRAYHHTYGLRVSISNCSNNYGPYHFPEKLIPLVIINILADKPLPIYGDGRQIRDWLYVEDHARGIELVIQRGEVGETYNIGGINEWANIDIVGLICRLLNKKFAENPDLARQFPKAGAAIAGKAETLISFVTDRPGHDRRYAINPDKAFNELGYEPKESFDSGIRRTIDWYLANESWWRRVMDGSYREWVQTQYSNEVVTDS